MANVTGRVAYKDMREYMDLLESQGLLKRIREEVDLKFEIGAITARSLERGGPALLFENVKATRASLSSQTSSRRPSNSRSRSASSRTRRRFTSGS